VHFLRKKRAVPLFSVLPCVSRGGSLMCVSCMSRARVGGEKTADAGGAGCGKVVDFPWITGVRPPSQGWPKGAPRTSAKKPHAMNRLLAAALLSLAALGLATDQASAFFRCCRWHCCNKCCATFCCRPYNAFTPCCFGSLCCDGCCPFAF